MIPAIKAHAVDSSSAVHSTQGYCYFAGRIHHAWERDRQHVNGRMKKRHNDLKDQHFSEQFEKLYSSAYVYNFLMLLTLKCNVNYGSKNMHICFLSHS